MSRKAPTRISKNEAQQALTVLINAAGDDNVTPMNSYAPSAVALLVDNGYTNHRASYVLSCLERDGVIGRIDNSESRTILRWTLEPARRPTPLSVAPKGRVENLTVAQLQAQLAQAISQRDVARNDATRMRARNAELSDELARANITKREAQEQLTIAQRELFAAGAQRTAFEQVARNAVDEMLKVAQRADSELSVI